MSRSPWVSRTAAAIVALSLLAAGACTWLADAAGAADAGSEARFVAGINAERSAQGLTPLTADPQLTDVARGWSAQMAADNRLSHNPNLSTQVTGNWRKLGENVGVGTSVDQIAAAFMASPAHRANILDPAFRLVGLGVEAAADGTLWVTEVFEQPAQEATPAPAPAPARAPAPRPASAPAARPARAAPPRPLMGLTATAAPPAPPPVDPAPPVAPAPPPPPPQASTRLVMVLSGTAALGAVG